MAVAVKTLRLSYVVMANKEYQIMNDSCYQSVVIGYRIPLESLFKKNALRYYIILFLSFFLSFVSSITRLFVKPSNVLRRQALIATFVWARKKEAIITGWSYNGLPLCYVS